GSPTISNQAYDGPPMTVEGSAGQHVVVMTAPTSGWGFGLDRTRREFGRIDVFVTATGPDPAVIQSQALVRHEVGSTVPTSNAIDVYARVLSHGEKASDQPYRLVLSAPGIPSVPAKTR